MRVINNRYTFITIIILLAISVILLGTSVVLKIANYGYVPYVDPNPDHELLHNDELYFYGKDDKLIGTYKCKANYVYCGLAYETIDDQEYSFRSYSDNKTDFVNVEHNRYVFIVDSQTKYEKPEDSNVILYDLKSQKAIKEFSAVKDYTIGLNGNVVFVKELNSGWRIMVLNGSEPSYLTDYTYEYVSVRDEILSNGKLDSSNIVTYDGNSWQLINDIGSERTNKTSKEIVDYNINYIIYGSNGLYQLQTLSDYALLNGNSYKQIKFIKGFSTYAELITIDDQYYIADFNLNKAMTSYYKTDEYPDIKATVNEQGEIEVISNGKVLETIKK